MEKTRTLKRPNGPSWTRRSEVRRGNVACFQQLTNQIDKHHTIFFFVQNNRILTMSNIYVQEPPTNGKVSIHIKVLICKSMWHKIFFSNR